MDVQPLISSSKWLQLHGLKRKKLSLSQILSQIGFQHRIGIREINNQIIIIVKVIEQSVVFILHFSVLRGDIHIVCYDNGRKGSCIPSFWHCQLREL